MIVVVVALSSWDFVKVVMIGGCHDGVSEWEADLVEVCCCCCHSGCPCQKSQRASHQMNHDHSFCFCCVRFHQSTVKFLKTSEFDPSC